ncbi:MAG: cache domain-containing protein [Bacteroidota bacterium]
MLKKTNFYLFLLAIFIALFSFSVYDYYQYDKNKNREALLKGYKSSQEIKNSVNKALDSLQKIAFNISEEISKKHIPTDELEDLLKKITLENEFFIGVTAACTPEHSTNYKKELHAPYFSRKNNKIEYIEDSYDYTDESLSNNKWYTDVIRQKKGVWSDPYISNITQELVVDYGIPFFRKDSLGNKKIAGIVSITISTAYITSYLHDVTLEKTGFAIITNEDNYLISHPSTELLTNPESSREIIMQQSEFMDLFNQNQKEGNFSAFSVIAQEDSEFFFSTLAQGWVLTIVMPKKDLMGTSKILKRKIIKISIYLSFILIIALIIILKVWEGDTSNLWKFSLSVATLLFANTALIWYLEVNLKLLENYKDETKVLSIATINNYINDRNSKLKKINSSLKSTEIKTGIFIYDIEFISAYNVSVQGKIWQKIPDSLDIKKDVNFTFPQASSTGISVRVRPMMKKHIDNYWLYRSDFNATFQFDFDYLRYPLNIKQLNLQMKYPNMDENILLIPDLDSYEFITPSLKPGISNDIYMPNSNVLSSYFTFNEHNFYSDLGNPEYKGLKETPVLTFNILIKNIILSTIISSLVTIFIIALMVFLLPFTVEKKDGEVLEGGSLSLIQAAGGFFFILILAHIQLRVDIETPGMIYLEIFYFVMYLMLAAMSASVLLYAKTNDYPILEYKNNLIFKISYWPLLLLSIYLITLFVFY